MMPVRSISDMAVFSLNIRGHGNSTDDEPAYNWWGPGDYVLRGIHTPEKYFYRAAILDCVRALDFLTTLPKVDPKRITVAEAKVDYSLLQLLLLINALFFVLLIFHL